MLSTEWSIIQFHDFLHSIFLLSIEKKIYHKLKYNFELKNVQYFKAFIYIAMWMFERKTTIKLGAMYTNFIGIG